MNNKLNLHAVRAQRARDAYADYWIGQKDGENSSGCNFSVYDDGYDDSCNINR